MGCLSGGSLADFAGLFRHMLHEDCGSKPITTASSFASSQKWSLNFRQGGEVVEDPHRDLSSRGEPF